jgi:hypothetical protein
MKVWVVPLTNPYNDTQRHSPHHSSPSRGEEKLFDLRLADFLSPPGERIKVRGRRLENSETIFVTPH